MFVEGLLQLFVLQYATTCCSIRHCVLIVCVTDDMILVFLMCNWYTSLESLYGIDVCVEGSEFQLMHGNLRNTIRCPSIYAY